MDIKEKKIRNAYEKASESGKKVLEEIFPELNLAERPITERVKTFEDAVDILGKDHKFVKEYKILTETAAKTKEELSADLTTYFKLRIICAALNEGWEPQFTANETRYYPWFYLYDEDELSDEDEVNELKARGLISTDQYRTKYAGFAYAASNSAPSNANANFGSRLCLKTAELARYCGTQFSYIWADFNLIRK